MSRARYRTAGPPLTPRGLALLGLALAVLALIVGGLA